jgi:hypothetical protein
LEIALDPHHDNQEEIKMPDPFQRVLRSSSKAKRSSPANASPSAIPFASTSHTSGDSTVNPDLVTRTIVEAHQMDIQNERKQRCIELGITAVELLKEIRGANGALEAICRVTSAILDMIKVIMVSLLLLR